jgi:hypothetical protein
VRKHQKCANFWIRFEQTQTPNYESMIAMSYSNGVKNFCTSFLILAKRNYEFALCGAIKHSRKHQKMFKFLD